METTERAKRAMLYAQLDLLSLLKFIDNDMEAYELPSSNAIRSTINELQVFTNDDYAADQIASWE